MDRAFPRTRGGYKLFVDYSGKKIAIVDAAAGEVRATPRPSML
jgi:hypothetical protein